MPQLAINCMRTIPKPTNGLVSCCSHSALLLTTISLSVHQYIICAINLHSFIQSKFHMVYCIKDKIYYIYKTYIRIKKTQCFEILMKMFKVLVSMNVLRDGRFLIILISIKCGINRI